MNKLTNLKTLAIRAHQGVSFSAEARGENMIKEFGEILDSDLELIKDAGIETKEIYEVRFRKHLTGYMNAKSRIMSPMITGSSNFPVTRMKKLCRYEDSAYKNFNNFRNKALKGIQRQIKRDKPIGADEAWQSIRKSIISSAATIIAIDAGEKGWRRPLFVNSITGLVKRIAKNGQVDHYQKSLALIRELNAKYKKPLIAEKNAIFTLMDVATDAHVEKVEKLNRKNKEFVFDKLGFTVVYNFTEDRLQVLYDTKPDEAVRDMLKKNGFKWAPSNSAWQRFLRRDGVFCLQKMYGINLEDLLNIL